MPRALAEVSKPISPRDRAGVTASGDALSPYSGFRRLPTLTDSPKPPEEPRPEPKPVEVPGPILLPPRPGRPGEGQPQGIYRRASVPEQHAPTNFGRKDKEQTPATPETDTSTAAPAQTNPSERGKSYKSPPLTTEEKDLFTKPEEDGGYGIRYDKKGRRI